MVPNCLPFVAVCLGEPGSEAGIATHDWFWGFSSTAGPWASLWLNGVDPMIIALLACLLGDCKLFMNEYDGRCDHNGTLMHMAFERGFYCDQLEHLWNLYVITTTD